MTPASVLSALDANQNWALDTLKSYLRIPSISAQNLGIDKASAFVKGLFTELGFQVRMCDAGGNPVVLAERKGPPGSKTLLFYNHYDVQPPDPLGEWTSPPFEPTIRNARLYARGVADNKANLIARIAAARSWIESDAVPCTLRFVVEGEEEVGSRNLPAFTEKEAEFLKSDLTIWETGYRDEDGRPQILLGCKGIAHGELYCRKSNQDVHSSRAVLLPNPAWRLAWALASIKGPDERITIDGFYDDIVEPDDEEAKMIGRIPFNDAAFRKQYGVDKLNTDLTGADLVKYYWYQPTFTVNGWGGGYQGSGHKTVLPAEAFVKFDTRLVPNMRPDRIETLIREHLDRHRFTDVELRHFTGYPPSRTPHTDPVVDLVQQAGADLWPEEFVTYPHMVMSGPMYLFRKHAPCIGIGVGHAESNIHAPDESVYVDDFHLGAKHVARLMGLMGHGKN